MFMTNFSLSSSSFTLFLFIWNVGITVFKETEKKYGDSCVGVGKGYRENRFDSIL